MDKITKMSTAIRLGAKARGESRMFFDPITKCGCAVTAAAEATGLKPEDNMDGEYFIVDNLLKHVSKRFNLGLDYVKMISNKHYTTGVTREQIADWLEQQGL